MGRAQIILDKAAISVSAVCAVHCLLMPVAVALLPTISATLSDEHFHEILLYFIVPSSAIALYLGCSKHKSKKVLSFGIFGLSVLIFTAFAGHELLSEFYEQVVSLLGSSLIAYSHLLNHRLCKHDCHDHE